MVLSDDLINFNLQNIELNNPKVLKNENNLQISKYNDFITHT